MTTEDPMTDNPTTDMIDVGHRGQKRRYFSDLWRLRQFMFALPAADLRERNMDTVLGNLWYLLNPIIQIGIYFAVFGPYGLDTSRGVDNFLTYLAFGVFIFRFAQQGVMSGAKALVSNRGLIRSIRFPRAVLPISGVLEETAATLPALIVAIAVALMSGVVPSLTWILLIPAFGLAVMFVLGGAFFAARLNERYRDVQQIIPFVFRMVFYLSAVIYSVEKFLDVGVPAWAFTLNPMYALLTLVRWPFIPDDSVVTLGVLISAMTWSALTLVFGFLYFRRGEARYGRR